mgnify:CR=1 FL=1
MRFGQLHGNEDVVKALVGMVDSGKVPHAIMFQEDDGGGAFPLCIAFLQYLYCEHRTGGDSCGGCPACNKISKFIHPDVHFVYPTAASTISLQYVAQFRQLAASNPYFTETQLSSALGIEGKNSLIAVSEAKHLLETLSLSALESGYRSVLIYLPEKMNADAANRLLKIIEEPPLQTQFLLITHHSERVLRTISSRCQLIRVKPASAVDSASSFASPELFSALMDALMRRDLLSALDAGEAIAALPSRETAKSFCKFASYQLRLIFLAQQGLGSPGSGSGDAIKWASAVPKTFPRAALAVFDNTSFLIDRNVNARLLFTDMVDRLFKLI